MGKLQLVITDQLPSWEGNLISYGGKVFQVQKVHGYTLVGVRHEIVLTVKDVETDKIINTRPFDIDKIVPVGCKEDTRTEFIEAAYALPDTKEDEPIADKYPKKDANKGAKKTVRRKRH